MFNHQLDPKDPLASKPVLMVRPRTETSTWGLLLICCAIGLFVIFVHQSCGTKSKIPGIELEAPPGFEAKARVRVDSTVQTPAWILNLPGGVGRKFDHYRRSGEFARIPAVGRSKNVLQPVFDLLSEEEMRRLAKVEHSSLLTKEDQRRLYAHFTNSVRVVQFKGTALYVISFIHADPVFAAEMANRICHRFVSQKGIKAMLVERAVPLLMVNEK